jgi:hypothetical protein
MGLGKRFSNHFSSRHGQITGRAPNGNRTRLAVESLEHRHLLSFVLSETAPARATSNGQHNLARAETDQQLNVLAPVNRIRLFGDLRTAVRDTREFSHDGPSRAIGIAGTRRIAWTGTEDRFSPFGEDLNYEVM